MFSKIVVVLDGIFRRQIIGCWRQRFVTDVGAEWNPQQDGMQETCSSFSAKYSLSLYERLHILPLETVEPKLTACIEFLEPTKQADYGIRVSCASTSRPRFKRYVCRSL